TRLSSDLKYPLKDRDMSFFIKKQADMAMLPYPLVYTLFYLRSFFSAAAFSLAALAASFRSFLLIRIILSSYKRIIGISVTMCVNTSGGAISAVMTSKIKYAYFRIVVITSTVSSSI